MTDPDRTSPSTSPEAARFGLPAFLLLALCVWIDQAAFAVQIGVDGAAGSFQAAMDHFFHTRARAGVDWVFTYGPLGYLQNLTYDPDLFVVRVLVVDVLWKAVCAAVFVRACLRNGGPVARVMPVFLLVLLPVWGDVYFYAVLLAGAELAIDAPKSTRRAVAFALVAIPLSLGKFTFCAVALPLAAAVTWVRWTAAGRAAGGRFAAGFAGAWLASWLALGQSLLDLPVYFVRSLRMASAYGEAMNTEARPELDTLALLLLLVTLGALVFASAHRWRAKGELVRAAARAFVVAVAYKAAIVRGFDHLPIFFTFAAVGVFLFDAGAATTAGQRVVASVLRVGVVFIGWMGMAELAKPGQPVVSTFAAVAGIQADACYATLTRLGHMRSMYDGMRADARVRRALPGVRSIVRDDPIDVLSPQQDSLLLNGLNYRPRPVFLSYAALDRGLQELNARFLADASGPKWLLFRPEAIDGRLETSEDALLPPLLAREWRPVLLEEGLLLFRREVIGSPEPAREVVFEGDLAFGKTLDLEHLKGDVKLLEFDVEPTLAGRARALALRQAELHGRFTSVEGRQYDARLVPSMFEAGAVVCPVLDDTAGWLRWYEGRPERLKSFVFLPPAPPWAFADEIHVRIVGLASKPLRVDPDLQKRFRFPGLETLPDAMDESKPGFVGRQGDELVRVFVAPATLRIGLPPGHRRIQGEFGVLDEAWNPGASDGVALMAQLETDGATRGPLFTRFLEPRDRPEHRGAQPFEFEVDVERAAVLLLRFRPGPNQDKQDDRAFLRRLRVD